MPVVWADEASPFTGAQVKALLEENERLRNVLGRFTPDEKHPSRDLLLEERRTVLAPVFQGAGGSYVVSGEPGRKHAESQANSSDERMSRPAFVSRPMTFGELAIGVHFVDFPQDGDDSGHGGFRGSKWIFEKLGPDYEAGTPCVDNARRLIDDATVAFPTSMTVLVVEGRPRAVPCSETVLPLPGVNEPYASMPRAELVDQIDRYAHRINELERVRDCLKFQKRQMQQLAEQIEAIDCDEDHSSDGKSGEGDG